MKISKRNKAKLTKIFNIWRCIFIMFKYCFQEKLKAVLRVIDEGIALDESARILVANKLCVKVWGDMYNQHGM